MQDAIETGGESLTKNTQCRFSESFPIASDFPASQASARQSSPIARHHSEDVQDPRARNANRLEEVVINGEASARSMQVREQSETQPSIGVY